MGLKSLKSSSSPSHILLLSSPFPHLIQPCTHTFFIFHGLLLHLPRPPSSFHSFTMMTTSSFTKVKEGSDGLAVLSLRHPNRVKGQLSTSSPLPYPFSAPSLVANHRGSQSAR
ncbi:unnamed protein product [Lupinus luteus]|uniref:Uncharacterized protein n=1 Tax=Lupinus luteus TaxID=3873 RepID=A0AAV1VZ96_LUPLU